jgi:hypothetical protein
VAPADRAPAVAQVLAVTLNTYGHLFPDAFADVGEALDRLVRGAEARAS